MGINFLYVSSIFSWSYIFSMLSNLYICNYLFSCLYSLTLALPVCAGCINVLLTSTPWHESLSSRTRNSSDSLKPGDRRGREWHLTFQDTESAAGTAVPGRAEWLKQGLWLFWFADSGREDVRLLCRITRNELYFLEWDEQEIPARPLESHGERTINLQRVD